MADMPHLSTPGHAGCHAQLPSPQPGIGFYCVALASFEPTEINSPLLSQMLGLKVRISMPNLVSSS